MIRILKSGLKFILSLLVIILALGAWLLFTESGKRFLVLGLNQYMSSEDLTVEVKQIESIFPFKIRVNKLILREKGQDMVAIKGAYFALDALKALKKEKLSAQLHVDAMSIFLRENYGETVSKTPYKEKKYEESALPLLSPNLERILDVDLSLTLSKIDVFNESEEPFIAFKDVMGWAKLDKMSSTLSLNFKGEGSHKGRSLVFEIEGGGDLFHNLINFRFGGQNIGSKAYSFNNILIKGEVKDVITAPFLKILIKGNLDHFGDVLFQGESSYREKIIQFQINDFKAPMIHLKGSGRINPITLEGYAEGKARFRSQGKKRIYPVDLSGELFMKAFYEKENLKISLKGNIENFRGFEFFVKKALIDLNLENILKKISGTAFLNISQVHHLDIPLDKAVFKGSFKDGKGEFSLEGEGSEFGLKAAGNISQDGETIYLLLNKLKGKYDAFTAALEKPTSLRLKGKDFKLSETRLSVSDIPIRLSIEVVGDKLKGKVEGGVNLGPMARSFLPPEQIINGKLDAKVYVRGELSAPLLSGRVSLTGGLYENLDFGIYLNDMRGEVDLEGMDLKISDFHAKSQNTGEITAKGHFNIKTQKADLTIEGKSLKVLDMDRMSLDLASFLLKICGNLLLPHIEGRIDILKGHYSIASPQKQEIISLNVKNMNDKDLGKKDSKSSSTVSQDEVVASFDIRIKSSPVLKVRGRGLHTTWKTDLHLKGTSVEPRLQGGLFLTKGKLNLLGNGLVLSKGSIQFSGRHRIQPLISLSANLKKSDYNLTVQVLGPPEAIQFKFSSSPPLSREEIISQLLFGKLSGSLSAFEAVQLGQSVHALTMGGDSPDLLEEIADTLGVDNISVGQNSEGNAVVNVDKKLNDRIKVSLEQGATTDDSAVTVETKVMENVLFNVTRGLVKPKNEVSLNYKKDY